MDLASTSSSQNTTLTNNKASRETYIKTILTESLPSSDITDIDKELQWSFILNPQGLFDKRIKPKKSKSQFLTRKQRKAAGLLKLPKSGWNYDELEPMRQLWVEYMTKNLNAIRTPGREDPASLNFNVTLGKSEYVGAEITVVRSKVPSVVGLSGTVVLETKSTFQIVDRKSNLKVLLKKPSVFKIRVNKMEFTIFGKHLLMKPNDRSIKKIKAQLAPDL